MRSEFILHKKIHPTNQRLMMVVLSSEIKCRHKSDQSITRLKRLWTLNSEHTYLITLVATQPQNRTIALNHLQTFRIDFSYDTLLIGLKTNKFNNLSFLVLFIIAINKFSEKKNEQPTFDLIQCGMWTIPIVKLRFNIFEISSSN